MSKKRTNYELQTLSKVLKIGVSKDKDILNLQIEDLQKIDNLNMRDIKNIIKLRKSVKENGLISYLSEMNKEEKVNVK